MEMLGTVANRRLVGHLPGARTPDLILVDGPNLNKRVGEVLEGVVQGQPTPELGQYLAT